MKFLGAPRKQIVLRKGKEQAEGYSLNDIGFWERIW
jgi:hypothetical protein